MSTLFSVAVRVQCVTGSPDRGGQGALFHCPRLLVARSLGTLGVGHRLLSSVRHTGLGPGSARVFRWFTAVLRAMRPVAGVSILQIDYGRRFRAGRHFRRTWP